MSFEELGENVIFEIISHLDAEEATRLLSTSQFMWSLKQSKAIESRIAPYQQLNKQKRWESGLVRAVQNYNVPQIHCFIRKGAYIEEGYYEALRHKNFTLIQELMNMKEMPHEDMNRYKICLIPEAVSHGRKDILEGIVNTRRLS